MSKPQNQFDIRVVERLMKRGIVSDKDLKTHITTLPDVLEKAVKIGTGEELDPEEFNYEIK